MIFYRKKSGYSLVEMIIYVSVLSVVSVLVINTIFSFAGPYRTLAALRAAEHSGIDSMERISRDIRAATSVDTANSTLGSSPGVLTLISTNGVVSTTTKFYIQNNILRVDVNGVYYGPVTISSTTITNLVFTHIQNTVSSAVKVDMTVVGTSGNVTKNKTYHSTVILKGI